MADVLVQFDEPQSASDGRSYIAKVCGQIAADNIWEGWIEFVPMDGRDPIRTPRETEQFTRGDLCYWASRLTHDALDAALVRAVAYTPRAAYVPPEFAGGETRTNDVSWETAADHVWIAPVLDPFAFYQANGGSTLRQELRSLPARELQEIIAAYEIPELASDEVHRTFEDAMAERIVAEVQHRVGSGRLIERNSEVETR